MTDSVAQSFRSLRETVGVFDVGTRGLLRVTGRDRAKYLHSMLSQDVLSLATGQGALACVLTAKAELVGFCRLMVEADAVLVDTDAECAAALLTHLRRFIVINQVKVDDASEGRATIAVEGPRAVSVVEAVTGARDLVRLAPCGFADASPIHTSAQIARFSTTGPDGFRLHVGLADRGAVFGALVAAAETMDGGAAEQAAVEAARLEYGWPVWGRELRADILPPLADVIDQRAIHYEKGCYQGQEPIARLHFRGTRNRLLCGLLLDVGIALPASDTPLFRTTGEDGGFVTSAAMRPSDGRAIALAYVRKEACEPGTILHVGALAGPRAEVVALASAWSLAEKPS